MQNPIIARAESGKLLQPTQVLFNVLFPNHYTYLYFYFIISGYELLYLLKQLTLLSIYFFFCLAMVIYRYTKFYSIFIANVKEIEKKINKTKKDFFVFNVSSEN